MPNSPKPCRLRSPANPRSVPTQITHGDPNMPTSETNRRDFVKLSGAALAVAATSSARNASAASYARIVGANDRVRTGVVGFGDRMKDGDIPAFQASAKQMNFELVAVSDIWKLRREQGSAYLGKLTGNKIDAVVNNEALY